jgi:hypothetical protein
MKPKKSFFKGTVSPDFEGFFMTHDIKLVHPTWVKRIFEFFHAVVILIFEDNTLMYITHNTS